MSEHNSFLLWLVIVGVVVVLCWDTNGSKNEGGLTPDFEHCRAKRIWFKRAPLWYCVQGRSMKLWPPPKSKHHSTHMQNEKKQNKKTHHSTHIQNEKKQNKKTTWNKKRGKFTILIYLLWSFSRSCLVEGLHTYRHEARALRNAVQTLTTQGIIGVSSVLSKVKDKQRQTDNIRFICLP